MVNEFVVCAIHFEPPFKTHLNSFAPCDQLHRLVWKVKACKQHNYFRRN